MWPRRLFIRAASWSAMDLPPDTSIRPELGREVAGLEAGDDAAEPSLSLLKF